MGYPSDGHREEKPLRLWPKKSGKEEACVLERSVDEIFCCLHKMSSCGEFHAFKSTKAANCSLTTVRSKTWLTRRSLASWTCQRFTHPFPWPLTACVVLCGVPSVVMPWVCLFVGTMVAPYRSNVTTGGLCKDMWSRSTNWQDGGGCRKFMWRHTRSYRCWEFAPRRPKVGTRPSCLVSLKAHVGLGLLYLFHPSLNLCDESCHFGRPRTPVLYYP